MSKLFILCFLVCVCVCVCVCFQSSDKFCNTRAALKACFQLLDPVKIPVERAMCVTAFTVLWHHGLCLKPTGTVYGLGVEITENLQKLRSPQLRIKSCQRFSFN